MSTPYEVQKVDKPEENCCILIITGKDGATLSKEDLEAASVIEKRRFETETGRTVYRMGFNPLAGGLRPQREVTEQLYKAGIEREEAFGVSPNGKVRVSQGRVGPVLNNGAVRPSNIKSGQQVMISTGAFVLDY